MFYRATLPRDLLAEFNRLQRELLQASEISSSIRGNHRGRFPPMNLGGTPQSIEIYMFAPGMSPADVEVHIEKGVLTISGERKSAVTTAGDRAVVHIDERFDGHFRRVVTLPEDADTDSVEATYRDGILHIRIARRAAFQPRRIQIQ